jgi:hypothetical protein
MDYWTCGIIRAKQRTAIHTEIQRDKSGRPTRSGQDARAPGLAMTHQLVIARREIAILEEIHLRLLTRPDHARHRT